MTFPPSQNLYGSSIGNAPHRPYVISTIDPTPNDVNYPLLQQWYNKSTQTSWSLTAFTSSGGIVSATWVASFGASVATDYVTDSGTAVPEAHTLNIVGGSGIDTSGTGNTVTISLEGGGVAIDSVGVQATSGTGTDPVVPTAEGLIDIDGAAVAAQSIPVQSRSASVSQLQIEVQRAADSTGTDTTSQGLASFDDTQFTVDANGYVTITGGAIADEFTVQAFTGPGTNPVVPDASNNINVNGAIVAAQAVPVRSNSLAANTYQIEVQRASDSTGTDTTSQGLASFNDTQFSVDANGYVSTAGVVALQFDGDTGSAVPSSGVIDILGTAAQGIVTSAAGSAVTITASDATTTQKGVLETATDAESIAGSSAAVAVTPASLAAKLGTQTANSIPYGTGTTAAVGWTSALTNGQLAIGSTGMPPVAANLTSTGGTITITNGAGSINLDLSGGGAAIDSFTVPSGTSPVVPDANGNIDLPAGNGFAFSGGTNAMTGNMVSPFTGDFTFTESAAGNSEILTVSHSDNTAAANSAAVAITVAGTTQTGDAYAQFNVGSARSYAIGPDTSASQNLKVTTTNAAGVTPSSGSEILLYSPTYDAWGMGATPGSNTAALTIARTQTTQGGGISINNLDNTTGTSDCVLGITTGGGSGGDPFIAWAISATQSYSLGIDNSDSDTFKLTNALGVSSGSTFLQSTVAGVVSLPLAGSELYIGTASPVLPVALNVQKEVSGGAVELEVRNTSDDASSDALIGIVVGDSVGTTAGDPFMVYTIATIQSWVTGIDNSDSDKFKLSASSAIGTTDVIRATVAGEVTMPLQPAFSAYLPATASNKTGNNTVYTIGTDALTEVFDQGGDFNTNGTFTAPTTGRYRLSGSVGCAEVTNATLAYFYLVTSNRTFLWSLISPTACKDVNAQFEIMGTGFADMDAGDTAHLTIQLSGIGADTADIIGGADVITAFSGNLEC